VPASRGTARHAHLVNDHGGLNVMEQAFVKRTRVAAAVAAIVMTAWGTHAHGAGFALQENAGSGTGNAFAGGAASAEDASTVWSNPAGMSRLASPQVAAAVHFITPSFKFQNEGSLPAMFQPFGGSGGDAGSLNVVPNLYVAVPIYPQWSVGVGINAPFGLVTEYDDNWLGRFQAVKSDIKTINVNPAVTWRVAPNFSVGLGVNWQRVDAELTKRINYTGALGEDAFNNLPAAPFWEANSIPQGQIMLDTLSGQTQAGILTVEMTLDQGVDIAPLPGVGSSIVQRTVHHLHSV